MKNVGSRVALQLGLSFGTAFLLLTTIALVLVAGGLLGLVGLYSILAFNNLYLSFIALYLSFPFALWFFGKRNAHYISKKKSNLRVSFRFSFGVNVFIWFVFLITQLILGKSTDPLIWGLITLIVVIVFGAITTFTIGLLIVGKTRNRMNSTQISPGAS